MDLRGRGMGSNEPAAKPSPPPEQIEGFCTALVERGHGRRTREFRPLDSPTVGGIAHDPGPTGP